MRKLHELGWTDIPQKPDAHITLSCEFRGRRQLCGPAVEDLLRLPPHIVLIRGGRPPPGGTP